jgi:hypothetical protein
MRRLKFKEFGKREMLVVGFVLALIAVYGTNISLVAIQNQPSALQLDYYISIKNSDGTTYAWTKAQGIPAEFDEAVLNGTIGCGVVFTSSNVIIVSVTLTIDGPTSGTYTLTQSIEQPEAWGTTVDTTQLEDGDYTFSFNAVINTTPLHPSGLIGGEETAPLSAFGIEFVSGNGNPKPTGEFPPELLAVIGLVAVLVIFTGSKTRRG